MYIRRSQKTQKSYEKELKIVQVLRKKLQDGDGWTRITMKSDGMSIDISVAAGNKFLLTFPPHYDATKGTIEFRCFEFEAPKDGKQNGLHAGLLKSWIVFCMAMTANAKACGYVPYRHIHEVSKERFERFLNGIGLKGDEFKTVRENLTRKLRRRAELAA